MVYEVISLFPTLREVETFKNKVAETRKIIKMEEENIEEVEDTEEA